MAVTDFLLQKEVDCVLAALMPQNALIIRTALQTGLRINDVLSLKPDQLKPNFWVTEAKTGKRKQVGLPKELLTELRRQAGLNWVFEGRDPTKHKTRQAIWYDVKRAAAAFRLPQNVAPHSFRKVYAVRLMEKYGNLSKVQKAMNHQRPEITMIYALADKLLEAKLQAQRNRVDSRGPRW